MDNLPLPPLIQTFTTFIKPVSDRINRNPDQSRTLRDTLLPALLSGELNVEELAKR